MLTKSTYTLLLERAFYMESKGFLGNFYLNVQCPFLQHGSRKFVIENKPCFLKGKVRKKRVMQDKMNSKGLIAFEVLLLVPPKLTAIQIDRAHVK